jgi:hypothetical protein
MNFFEVCNMNNKRVRDFQRPAYLSNVNYKVTLEFVTKYTFRFRTAVNMKVQRSSGSQILVRQLYEDFTHTLTQFMFCL